MKNIEYHENKERGSFDFPCEYHHLENGHPRYTMPYHWHTECEIIRILHGEFSVLLDGQAFLAAAGDILLLPEGMLHGGHPSGCEYECIVFDMQRMIQQNPLCKKLLYSAGLLREVVFLSDSGGEISDCANLLFDTMAGAGAGYKLVSLGLFYQLIGRMLDIGIFVSYGEGRADAPRINRFKTVLSVIDSRFAEQITLEELSRSVGMSPKYFCRFFRQMSRRTPIDYLNYYRIERACEMLSGSDTEFDKTISDIAFCCGFNDLSYFIKTFKKYKNTTPGRFRAQILCDGE